MIKLKDILLESTKSVNEGPIDFIKNLFRKNNPKKSDDWETRHEDYPAFLYKRRTKDPRWGEYIVYDGHDHWAGTIWAAEYPKDDGTTDYYVLKLGSQDEKNDMMTKVSRNEFEKHLKQNFLKIKHR